jgi:HlyD family secretion protein
MGGVLIALLAAACSGAQATETVPASDVPVVAESESQVLAEGVVEPARWTELRVPLGSGKVIEVPVEPGERVSEGDLLVRMDPTDAQLAVEDAEAALAVAQAELARVVAGSRPEEVAVTEARLEAARAAVREAEARRDRLTGGETQADIAAARSALAEAMASEKQAFHLHERTLKCFTFEWGGEEYTICPALGRPEEQARYAWQAAEDALTAAEAQLAAAESQAGARIRDAEAAVSAASARVQALDARLALERAGSRPEQVAAAEADVASAEAALRAVEAAVEKTVVRAPFDGAVVDVAVDAGDTIAPGQIVVVVARLDQLQVLTQDLTELDVVKLAVGQPAVVTLDAMPNRPLEGRVTRIDQQATDYRGDVTYPVLIEVDQNVLELRWGMTALVEIDVKSNG